MQGWWDMKVVMAVYIKKINGNLPNMVSASLQKGNSGNIGGDIAGRPYIRIFRDPDGHLSMYYVYPYKVYEIEHSDVSTPKGDNKDKAVFSNFMGMVHGGGFNDMYGVFSKSEKSGLLPSNTLRNSSVTFKGRNDNYIAGEGVYFRFVKDEAGMDWNAFLNNVAGKGSGGGVIYFMPSENAEGLKFTHAMGHDGG